MNWDKKALMELAKTFGRFVWFGLLGVVAVFLTSLATDKAVLDSTWTVFGMTLPVGTYIAFGVGFAAKAIDRYIHKSKTVKANGIAPSFLQGK